MVSQRQSRQKCLFFFAFSRFQADLTVWAFSTVVSTLVPTFKTVTENILVKRHDNHKKHYCRSHKIVHHHLSSFSASLELKWLTLVNTDPDPVPTQIVVDTKCCVYISCFATALVYTNRPLTHCQK